jgi:ABC-2 type transport system permease protein
MATGIGFIIASLAKGDMMSVFSWGIPVFIILFIPLFGVIFPGTITGWVKVIPSYYLVDAVHRASNFGAGWGDVGLSLLILFGVDIALTAIGIWALGRKSR